MTFQWPYMLLLSLVPVFLMLAQALLARKRQIDTRNFPQELPQIRRGLVAGGRVRFPPNATGESQFPWRFWLAFLLVVVALARPQWGRDEQSSLAPSGEILIALDLSRSMLTTDVPPSRLDRARAMAIRLVDELPGFEVGLIGFAGAAYLLAPPSDDRATLRAFLPEVMPDHVVTQGTDFAALLDVALAGFNADANGRTLVILSDGEAESAAWRERLPALRQNDVRIITVGFGTPEGANVPAGEGKWLLDSAGSPVRSRLSPTTLSELARESGGEYLDAERHGDLATVVRATRTRESGGTAGSQAPGAELHPADRFAWFLGAALLLLAWSAAREWRAKPRIRRLALPAARAAFVAGCALLILQAVQPRISDAARPPRDPYEDEQEPLLTITTLVSSLIRKNELGAGDYLEFANAATRYGEFHRGHGHPIAEGVLHDGLAAIEQGRALDPDLADWDAMHSKLERLLEPPPPAPDEDPSPPDPANERLDAKLEVPVVDNRRREEPEDENQQGESAAEQGMRNVGGSRRDVYDPSEWRNASLVQPLYQLERLRGTDSPAELFRLMQSRNAAAPEKEQSW